MISWSTERRKLKDLVPAKYNPRKLTEQQEKDLTASLSKFNLADPVIINKNNTVIGGHQRLIILKKQGVEEVDVRVPDRELSEKEEKELNLRLNKNTGEFVDDLLKEFDQDMLLDVGFDSKDIDRLFPVTQSDADDAVPAPPVEPVSKPGDVWELGEHRVMCGDATKIEDVEKLMAGRKADMVFTDPPYNVNYGATMRDKLGYKVSKENAGRKILNDHFPDKQAFYQFLYDAISSARPFVAGDVYVCMSSSELHTLQKAFSDCGGHWSTFIIWVKNTFTIGRANYQRQYEPILYGWFEGSSHYWSGRRDLGDVVLQSMRTDADGSRWVRINDEDGVATDVWEFDKPLKNKEHPTMKPVTLVVRAVKNSSKDGDIVLDPFLGSGSTLIACEKTSRVCYGLELDPVYVDVCKKRWEDFTGKKAHLVTRAERDTTCAV